MENEFINLEQPPKTEGSLEKKKESVPKSATEKINENLTPKVSSAKQAPATEEKPNNQVEQVAKDPQVQQIEDILSDGLGEYYTKLRSADQQKFKESGEQAAAEVATLLQKTVVKVEEIIFVIRKWLSSVPGLNKFFVEQAAKIKADRIYIIGKKD